MIAIRTKNAEMRGALLAKSERAVELPRLMLGDDAAYQDIEDQAVARMYLPSDELAMMQERWLRHYPQCSK